MRNHRTLIVRFAVLGAILLAVALFLGGRSHRTYAGPSLSALTLQGEPDAHRSYPTKAHVTLSAGRTFAAGRTVRASGSGSSTLTFGQPTMAGINGVGFEASLRLDPSNPNRMYESAPGSLSSDTSWVWGSADGGKTWKWVTAALPQTGKYSTCAGGGDTELAVDSTGSLYFNDLTLVNFSTGRSDDHGTTVTCSNTGVPDAVVDRQWYTIDGDPKAGGAIYLVNDEIGPGAPDCPGSQGNNVLVMYRSPVGLAATAGIQFGPANKISGINTCNEGIMGNNELSPVATTKSNSGTPLATPVKHIYVIHDDASFSKILIGRCYPVDILVDPSGLSCTDLPVADLGDPTKVRTGANFPTMAIDRAGNLYAVWAQSAIDAAGIIGDAVLKYTYSKDEGDHWSTPVTIPTGLKNNVMPWIAAGDDGRVDIGFYGTSASVDRENFGPQGCTQGGPDAVNGFWSIYVTQSLNAHSSSVTFSKPVDASGHPIHHGSIQTVIGHQCGDRTLGDFFQLRLGPNGEAHTSFGDSNNIDEVFAPHAMHVRQIGGSGLYKNRTVSGDKIKVGSVSDPAGDGTYDAGGLSSPSMPNLDIVASSVSAPSSGSCHPAGACYRITMTLANLSLDAPASPDTDDVLIWQTQWLLPAKPGCTTTLSTCQNGGRNLMVYAESNDGGEIQCWVGENAVEPIGGGVALTYPGTTQLAAPGACTATMGPNGKITIDVPKALVALEPGVSSFNSTLWSVTATTLTAPAPPDTVPNLGGIGGVFFNEIDAARGYNAAA